MPNRRAVKIGIAAFEAGRTTFAESTGAVMPAGPTDKDVFEIEDRRFRAMASNDLKALDLLLPEDLHYVHANGAVEDKTEFLRKLSSGERIYRRFEAVSRVARHEKEFTFVFGDADVEVDRAAGRLTNRLTYTAIYRHHPELKFFAWHAVKSASG
jgi:hypothetical protein